MSELRNGQRLSRMLERAASTCERHFETYAAQTQAPLDSELRQALIFAIAALRTAAQQAAPTTDALKLVCLACHQALAVCMRHGFEDELLKCAASLEPITAICEKQLGV
jgi:hypothetical protein